METSVQNGQVIFTDGEDRFTVTLHRTLRLPDNGNTHALPPSMGHFPIKRVADYADKVPKAWLEHGGVFFPMWQREAMWLQFGSSRRPFACKVAAGKINAVSGKEWKKELAPSDTDDSGDPRQDYIVAPPQPWLDGFNSGNGVIKQFVAMPLGQGYTVEGQVTGKEEFGGIQIMAVPPKEGLLVPKPRRSGGILRSTGMKSAPHLFSSDSAGWGGTYSSSSPVIGSCAMDAAPAAAYGDTEGTFTEISDSGDVQAREVFTKASEMGLAAGGSMVQKIYPDPHGLDAWAVKASGRMFIHIVNSEMYEQITGEKPPKSPITAHDYEMHGYPWFKVWDEEAGDVSPSKTLKGVKTVAEKDKEHGFTGQQNDDPLKQKNVLGNIVMDGSW